MGRHRKADLDAVVELNPSAHGFKWGVVVDYRDDVFSNRYGVVQTDRIGRNPRGSVIWVDSPDFKPTGRISRRPGRITRKNNKHWGAPEQRGCGCQCCPHMDLGEGAEEE